MTSANKPVARAAREARGPTSLKILSARELSDDVVSSPMMQIGEGRFLWCRGQQDRRYLGGA